MIKTDADEWDHIVQEWRAGDAAAAGERADALQREGWVKEGPSTVKAGTFANLYMQQWRRPKRRC